MPSVTRVEDFAGLHFSLARLVLVDRWLEFQPLRMPDTRTDGSALRAVWPPSDRGAGLRVQSMVVEDIEDSLVGTTCWLLCEETVDVARRR
jgi:hypothetical protein